MAGWFETVTVAPGVTRIVEPHVHPFFRANLYRIEGRDFDIQLDFGTGVRSMAEVSPSGGKPVVAIATHAHVDHIGCFHEYADRAGHPAEADIFATMSDEGTLCSWFIAHPQAMERAPSPDFDLQSFAIPPAPLARLLDEGDVVDAGDRRFRILHLPGHSPGSIALLDEANGEFFAGDAIYQGGLVDDIPGADIGVYIETMRRLAELDVRIVHAGHGPSIDRETMRAIALDYVAGKQTGGA